jgi:hypothetical protein
MDYKKIVLAGLRGWWKNSSAIRLGIVVAIVSFAFSLLLAGIGILFFGSLEQYARFSVGSIESSAFMADLSPFVGFLSVSLLFGIVLFFIYRILGGKMVREALHARQRTPEFGTGKGLRFALLAIASFLMALFSWYNKKWLFALLGFLVGFALFFAGIISKNWVLAVFGVLFAVLLGFVYLLVMVYNSARLYLADVVFVGKKQSVFSSLQESWKISEKKVFRIFIAFFLVGIAYLVVSMIIGVIPADLSFASNFYSPLLLPAFLANLVTNAIVSGLFFLILCFAAVETYEQILREPLEEK